MEMGQVGLKLINQQDASVTLQSAVANIFHYLKSKSQV